MTTNVLVALVIAAHLAAGCASEPRRQEPPSDQQLADQELAAERQDFVTRTHERLAAIGKEIRRLHAKLDNEPASVDADTRASWSRDLFERERQRNELQAWLEHARTARPQQYEKMRPEIGAATDSLQVAVSKLGAEISRAVASPAAGKTPHEPPSASRQASDMGISDHQSSALHRTVSDSPAIRNLKWGALVGGSSVRAR